MLRRTHNTTLAAVLVAALLACASAIAQVPGDTARYQFWRPADTTFRLIGTNVAHMDAVRDLGFDYVRGYNPFSAADLSRLMNHPNSALESVRSTFFKDAYRSGFTIINPITDVGIDLKNLRVIENYAKADPIYFHNLYFHTLADSHVYDTVMHGLAFGIVTPASSEGELLVAGGPVYNAYWVFHQGDPTMYQRIGMPDRSTWFRVSVALKVDVASDEFRALPPRAVLGRVVLYRRVRESQQECRCAAYAPFDSIAITKQLYLDSATAADGAPGYREVGTTFNAAGANVPLHVLNRNASINGDGFDWFGPRTCPDDTCRAKLARGEFGPGAILEDVDKSDFNLRFYSERIVPVSFLRSRINQDLYDQLRAGRLDSILRRGVRELLRHDTLRRLLARLPYSDETTFHKYRSDGLLARKLQDFLRLEGDSTLQLWCNPPDNFAAFRMLTGDLDSDRLKTIQLIVRQDYKQIGAQDDGIPIFYANPDSMSAFATARTYGGMILGHADSAYTKYEARRQQGFGKFLDSKTGDATFDGPLVRSLARLVDVAKIRYRAFGPPTPVWNTIQDYGIRGYHDHPAAAVGAWYAPWGLRPPTPEEITAQCWLSLNCGVDGLVYADLQYDGLNFGPIHNLRGIPVREYDSLFPPNITWLHTRADSLAYIQPLAWTGFLSRYRAIKAIDMEIRHLDSLVHFTSLRFAQEQMSVFDPAQSFAAMPLADTLITERARRYERGPRGEFLGSDTIDTRRETYIELSHFVAGPRAPSPGAHYLILTNRRCWPVDTLAYGDSATAHGAHATGLGAIDVRRPIITLKKIPGIDSDTFTIEKVGHENEWPRRRVRAGERVPLDWLRPGWGAVYKITS